MSYSTDKAKILTDVLDRVATLEVHQLVGHRDNLAFWLDEVRQALSGIDGYSARFARMKQAQVAWVRAHDVKVSPFCPACGGGCEFGPEPPRLPVRVPSHALDEARLALREAARRFLHRLYAAHMLSREDVISAADDIGTGFEPEELERAEPPVTQ